MESRISQAGSISSMRHAGGRLGLVGVPEDGIGNHAGAYSIEIIPYIYLAISRTGR